jgi:hypothetical protein
MSKNKKNDINANFNTIKDKIFNNEDYKKNNVYQIKMNWYSKNSTDKIPIEFYAQIKPIVQLSGSTQKPNNRILILGFRFIFLKEVNKNGKLQNFDYPKKLDFYKEPAKSAILNLRSQFKPYNFTKKYYEICIYAPSIFIFKQKTILFWERLNEVNTYNPGEPKISIVQNARIIGTNSPSNTKISSTSNNSFAISSAKKLIQESKMLPRSINL